MQRESHLVTTARMHLGFFFPFSSFALATTITNQVLASKPFVLICFSFPVCSLFSAEALCCKSNLLRSSRMDFVRFAITENRSNSIFAVGILCYSYSLNGFFFCCCEYSLRAKRSGLKRKKGVTTKNLQRQRQKKPILSSSFFLLLL